MYYSPAAVSDKFTTGGWDSQIRTAQQQEPLHGRNRRGRRYSFLFPSALLQTAPEDCPVNGIAYFIAAEDW